MSFISKKVKFKRHSDDLIHPTCDVAVEAGEVVCYEIPAKSTGNSLKLDILRYTMQCVYGGECLFPCAFNQKAPNDDVKVFFDYVFRTKYRREVSEKLALALYAQNQSRFIFKTLGIFDKTQNFNCRVVNYENGETFLVATKGIAVGEILTASPRTITVPSFEEEKDFETTLRLMSKLDLSDCGVFTEALSYRERAKAVRPEGRVVVVNSNFDPDLDKRMAKYKMDKELGIATFHAGVERLSKKAAEVRKKDMESKPEDLERELEEVYNRLYEDFESDEVMAEVETILQKNLDF